METDALDEAAEHLKRAAALDPKMPEAPYNLGNLAEKRGDDTGAADHFRRAAALRPAFYEAHNNLGAGLLKAGDAKAGQSFARAVALKPAEAEAHPRDRRAWFGGLGHIWLRCARRSRS